MSEHRDRDPSPDMDPEPLAAFLDGRLPADERQRVMERLALSDDEYDVFLDALHAVHAEEKAGPGRGLTEAPDGRITVPAGPAPAGRPGGRRPRWLHAATLAAAAAVAALLLLPWMVDRLDRTPDYTPGVLLASLGPAARAGAPVTDPPWRVLRAGDTMLSPAERAFRLGVRHVHLEIAVLSGDDTDARRIAGDMAVLAAGLPGGAAYAAPYREMAALPVAHARGDRLRRDAWKALLATDMEPELRMGAWVATARHAALAGRPQWAWTNPSRWTRDAVDADALDLDVRAAWESTLDMLEVPVPDAEPAARLVEALDAVVRAAAG